MPGTLTIRKACSRKSKSQRELQRRAAELLSGEIPFIHHASFQKLTPAKVLAFSEVLHVDESTGKLDRRIPTALTPLFRTPLLTPAGEQHLFRKLNYFRYRAVMLRAKLDASRPQAMLVAEIEECLAHAESARKVLVEANLRLVAAIARKFRTQMLGFDELLSEGSLVLVAAIDKFDFSRGFRFSTYATHAVQRHIYRVMQRKQKKWSREIDTDIEVMAKSVAAPPEEYVEDEFPLPLRKRIRRALLSDLDDREREIISCRFGLQSGEERTLKELSEQVGLSKERVRQIQHRAVARLRAIAGVEKV